MLCYNCMNKIEETDIECPFCGSKTGQEYDLHHLRPGTVLQGRYIVGNSLGEGGFGITYIGFDQKLRMRVAIKEYYPNGYVNRNNTISATVSELTTQDKKEFFEKGREKFTDEARVLAKFCGKPGIVAVRDLFDENNTAYIVMEYLDGITLKEYIKENGGKIPAKNALELIMPIVDSLKDIHRQNIIHRDISPDNIMIANGKAALLDFGAAREYADNANKSLSVMLKHGYAPPEQYGRKGNQGPWTDIYAICATLYKCITGITLDDASDRLMSDTVLLPSALGIEIDESVERTIMKGLSLQVCDRFKSIDELLDGFSGNMINSSSEKNTQTANVPQISYHSKEPINTELPLKPDSVSGTTDSEKNAPLIVSAAKADDDIPQKTVAVVHSIKERSAVKPNKPNKPKIPQKHKNKFKIIFSLCAACILLILAVIFISKPPVKQDPVETTVTILGKYYDVATTTSMKLSAKSIDDAQLKELVPQLKKLKNLKVLDLSYNNISEISPLAQLTDLTELNLHNNKIRTVTPLAELTKLTFLSLGVNQLRTEDIENLKERMPNCTIMS